MDQTPSSIQGVYTEPHGPATILNKASPIL